MSAAEVTVNLGEEAEESAIPTSDNPDPTSALAEALLDEDENAAGNAVASVFTRIRELTSENATLRSELNDERESKLTLLEVNRELDWRVRTGSSASPTRVPPRKSGKRRRRRSRCCSPRTTSSRAADVRRRRRCATRRRRIRS